jgi:Protein of unknown function (DUF3311)
MAPSARPGRRPVVGIAVTVLLLIAIGGTLWVPLYARSAPKLGDFPFFYWYQLIWVPVVAVLSWVCALLLRTNKAKQPNSRNAPGEPR